MTHHEEVVQTAKELRRQLEAFRATLPTNVVEPWENVVAMLDDAASRLDPERADGVDLAAYEVVAEAERILREDLGRMAASPELEQLRYAALDGHKRLHRNVLS